MSFPMVNLENFLIPLKDIEVATHEFDEKYKITDGEYSTLYRGQLSGSSKNHTATFKRFIGDGKEFLNELKVISKLNHKNITPFLGYCDEEEEMILVYEYTVNGTLANYLVDPDKRRCLTWRHRLEICLDAARGLNYLHSGLGQHDTVIHGSFMGINILLDDNLKAKICGFEISEFIPVNSPCKQVYKPAADKNEDSDDEDIDADIHKDPIYLETGFLNVELDVYSFGVLLFSILTWPEANVYRWRSGDGDRGMPNSLTMLVHHYYDNRLGSLIDPPIRDQIGGPSFRMIEEITCKCLSYNIKDRPKMDTLVKTIKDALDIHNQEAISVKGSHGEIQNPREVLIPFKEIELAMGMFKESSMPPPMHSFLYTAELSERWPNRTVVFKMYTTDDDRFDTYDIFGLRRQIFYSELNIVSRFHHENIIPYIGYCDDGDNKILIYEHAVNGSLRDHLQDQDKLRCLPWEQRLKICLGAARGLKCLHSGLWDENRLVVHRYFRSEYILLDENMDAKISEFGLSKLVPRNKPQVSDYRWEFEMCYLSKDFMASMDPIYRLSYIVNTEVDVYSFAVVMFEILSGLICKNEEPNLINNVHRYYNEDELDKLIDPNIRHQINGSSLGIFVETAYKCLSYNIKERPSMNRIIKRIEEALYIQNHGPSVSTTTKRHHQYEKLENLVIPLEEIKSATSEFSENSKIGNGGFGVVYKGKLSQQWQNHEVAIKRLNKTSHQANTDFLNELNLISRFHHHNIIHFIGYCNEGDEKILVYECANNGSLESYLEKPNKRPPLTWVQRLKICLGAAKGLDYLHLGLGDDNRVIHRDVKSGNILLDDNWEAKICDFGFSKSDYSASNLQQSKFYTKVAGTNFYMDPIYHESGILRTESDVYSFGVVMFEMLSGMLAWYQRRIGDDKPQPLINLVRRYYDYGKKLLIDPKLENQVDDNSFQTFIEIAYQCISLTPKERPTMETVIDKIEEALDYQLKEEVPSKGC